MTVQAGADVGSASNGHRGRPTLLLLTWAILLIVLAALAPWVQQVTGISFDLFSLVMLAPALACVVVLIRPQWAPNWWPPVHAGRVLTVSATAVAAVAVFAVVLAGITGRGPTWPPAGLSSPAWLFVLLQATGALGEEIGWRGVVQRTGEKLARPGVVSAIAGFLFGATHLGYWSLGPLPVLTFALTAMLMSLTITTIFDGSLWQRMIPALIVHLGINLTIAAFAGLDQPLATTLPALLAAAVMLAATAAVKLLLLNRQRRE